MILIVVIHGGANEQKFSYFKNTSDLKKKGVTQGGKGFSLRQIICFKSNDKQNGFILFSLAHPVFLYSLQLFLYILL